MNSRQNSLLLLVIAIVVLVPSYADAESIYKRAKKQTVSLFEDFKARKVGDIVTILIIESNSASEKSSVATQKSHEMEFKLTNLFGLGDKLFSGEPGNLTQAGFEGDNQYDGQASTSNSGQISAQITATVKEVHPNGNMLIEGRRAIHLNEEQKNIVLTGTIRSQDITSQNTICSTQVADAQITFEGFGDVSDQAKPGFLSRLLNLIPIF